MPSELQPICIDDPGVFILPDGQFPIASLRVLRNQREEPDELIFVFDNKLRTRLRLQKTVWIKLKGIAQPIEIDAIGEPCCDQEFANLHLRHLHLTMLPPALVEVAMALITLASA